MAQPLKHKTIPLPDRIKKAVEDRNAIQKFIDANEICKDSLSLYLGVISQEELDEKHIGRMDDMNAIAAITYYAAINLPQTYDMTPYERDPRVAIYIASKTMQYSTHERLAVKRAIEKEMNKK